jgi:hypothetical protein
VTLGSSGTSRTLAESAPRCSSLDPAILSTCASANPLRTLAAARARGKLSFQPHLVPVPCGGSWQQWLARVCRPEGKPGQSPRLLAQGQGKGAPSPAYGRCWRERLGPGPLSCSPLHGRPTGPRGYGGRARGWPKRGGPVTCSPDLDDDAASGRSLASRHIWWCSASLPGSF